MTQARAVDPSVVQRAGANSLRHFLLHFHGRLARFFAAFLRVAALDQCRRRPMLPAAIDNNINNNDDDDDVATTAALLRVSGIHLRHSALARHKLLSHVSHDTCYTSHYTCYTSHDTSHTSHVTR